MDMIWWPALVRLLAESSTSLTRTHLIKMILIGFLSMKAIYCLMRKINRLPFTDKWDSSMFKKELEIKLFGDMKAQVFILLLQYLMQTLISIESIPASIIVTLMTKTFSWLQLMMFTLMITWSLDNREILQSFLSKQNPSCKITLESNSLSTLEAQRQIKIPILEGFMKYDMITTSRHFKDKDMET